MISNPNCRHSYFHAEVTVSLLSKLESGAVDDFAVDIQVRCADCGLRFRFPGIQHGVHYEPRTSLDGTELRVSIEPAIGAKEPTDSYVRKHDPCLSGLASNVPCSPDATLKRCAICGFVVDTKHAADKPTVRMRP